MSDEYELADIASYLEVPAEEWFDWTVTKRAHYISKFNELSVEDLTKGKNIPEIKEQRGDQESLEFKELPENDINSLYDTAQTLFRECQQSHLIPLQENILLLVPTVKRGCMSALYTKIT